MKIQDEIHKLNILMSACVESMVGSDAEDKHYKVLKLFTRKTKILINFKF